MAFNPAHYETIYGFDTLDTFHNFFPELVYDDAMFPTSPFAWMRHRMNTLFPSVYVRQQNLYRIYLSAERTRQYNDFISATQPADVMRTPIRIPLSARRLAVTPVTIPVVRTGRAGVPASRDGEPVQTSTETRSAIDRLNNVVRIATNQISTNSITTDASGNAIPQQQTATATAPATAPATATATATTAPIVVDASGNRATYASVARTPLTTRNLANAYNTNFANVLTNLLTATLPIDDAQFFSAYYNDINPTNLSARFAAAAGGADWSDVPVIPTNDEIASGSEVMAAVDVPLSELCAICQERGEPAQNWRRLNCAHYYHQPCIDTWFERNVHCPVCRTDIRESH